MIRNALFLLCLSLLPFSGIASEEEFVPWQSITVKSPELPVAGVVTVEATASGAACQKFAIGAFGRTRSLTASELKRLESFPMSSMSITHEAGYASLGGHTVHVRLQRTYVDPAQKVIRETICISLPKDAELRISEPKSTQP